MKLRFILFTMCLLVVAGKMQAQWSDQYSAIATKEAINSNVATVSATGDVLVAGVFTQEFSFGSYDLEPVANSTYLLKYNSDGIKQWAVAFAGAVTPTAITTDNEGNIYIAGLFTDAATFHSTDKVNQVINGLEIFGEPDVEQRTGYIAKYSSAGVLLKVHAYKPVPFEESSAQEDLFYLQDIFFHVTSMEFHDGKLLASVKYTGIVESNGHTIKASYVGVNFFTDIPAGAFLELNTNDLTFNNVIATLVPKINSGQSNMNTIRFSLRDGKLYGVFYVFGGTPTLTVKDKQETIAFPQSIEVTSGHVFVQIDMATGNLASFDGSFFKDKADHSYSIGSFYSVGEKLVLTGTYSTPLPFKPELGGAKVKDVFVAALDANDMSKVNFAVSTSVSDGAVFASSTLSGDQLLVVCNETTQSGILASDLTDGSTMTYTPGEANVFTNVIVSKHGIDLKVQAIKAAVVTDPAITKIVVEKNTSGIAAPSGAVGAKLWFDAASNTLRLSQIADAAIYSSSGVLIRTVSDSQSINLSDIPKGIYIATVRTNDGISRLKFSKN